MFYPFLDKRGTGGDPSAYWQTRVTEGTSSLANQKKQNSEAAGGTDFFRVVHAKDCGVVAVPGKLGLLKSKPGQRENNASKLHRSAGLKIRTSHVKLLEI